MSHRNWHLNLAERNKKASVAFKAEFEEWAVVALFYSALHYVHSSLADEPQLERDERHPRKHTGAAGDPRGVNQLVRDEYPEIHRQYVSLFEMSRRTRYDTHQLGPMALTMLEQQWADVRKFCETRNGSRPARPSRDV